MKRTQQDVGTIVRKKRTRGPDVWVWRFYETDEMGITRKLLYHIQVMVMIAMCLGLRISEIRALQ